MSSKTLADRCRELELSQPYCERCDKPLIGCPHSSTRDMPAHLAAIERLMPSPPRSAGYYDFVPYSPRRGESWM